MCTGIYSSLIQIESRPCMVCVGRHTKKYTRTVRINYRMLHLLVLLSYFILMDQINNVKELFNALDPVTSNLREMSTKIANRPEVNE